MEHLDFHSMTTVTITITIKNPEGKRVLSSEGKMNLLQMSPHTDLPLWGERPQMEHVKCQTVSFLKTRALNRKL